MPLIYNFSAGPAMLPAEVVFQAEQELAERKKKGISVMEISHRSEFFQKIAKESEQDLKDLLNIPSNYKVLFCQGGARGQFAAVPMNLLGEKKTADYITGGYWSKSAILEAKKYGVPNIIDVSVRKPISGVFFQSIKPISEWQLSEDAAYVHYCPNETIEGIAIHAPPIFSHHKDVVADFSSSILSCPIDVDRYGVIYAGAQKNIGPAGLTVVIVRDDLLGKAHQHTPSILNYQVLADTQSMFNTPPTFAWYLSGLVFKWLKDQGGLIEIQKRNREKAQLLYSTIDENEFYLNQVAPTHRSLMNVPFLLSTSTPRLDELFLSEAKKRGLEGLKGHRAATGMRASIYNAMPVEGVQKLTEFMVEFARRYG